jgi:hypothetical protein
MVEFCICLKTVAVVSAICSLTILGWLVGRIKLVDGKGETKLNLAAKHPTKRCTLLILIFEGKKSNWGATMELLWASPINHTYPIYFHASKPRVKPNVPVQFQLLEDSFFSFYPGLPIERQ